MVMTDRRKQLRGLTSCLSGPRIELYCVLRETSSKRRTSRKITNDVTPYTAAIESGNNVNLASGNKNQIATPTKTRTIACTVKIDVSNS